MFIQSLLKNSNYVVSKRNFLSDYSRIESKKIDMTLSGKFLSSYGNLKINPKEFDKYPSHDEINKLEQEIKNHENIQQEIILGAGANGILQNIIKLFFVKRGNLVTPFYTFNQVEFGVTSFNGKTYRVFTDNYKINFNKMKKAINRKTRMVYICNPNNPTGLYENCENIINFAKSINVPVVVDESGIEFTNKKSLLSYKNIPKNLLIVRSFSKAYGIANFRLGYLVCNPEFKQSYLENITTNEFSGLSCIVANELLKNGKENITNNIKSITKEKKVIIKKLDKIGIKCILSDSNTIMTDSVFKNEFLKLLEQNNISVVPVYDENNKLHIRIAIQDEITNKKFVDILVKIMNEYQVLEDGGKK